MGFTRITASLVGVAHILAVVVIATPQGYQPFRPYDPTGTSASNNNIDTTGNSDGASSTNSGGVFGNDDTGLDNGVDDNNGTPFGVDTNRGGSGSTDPTPDPDPAPTCAGALRCCDNPFSGLYSVSLSNVFLQRLAHDILGRLSRSSRGSVFLWVTDQQPRSCCSRLRCHFYW